jgi:hypothetical protein
LADELLRIPQQMNSDLFGGGDAVVKYVLEVGRCRFTPG